jgi:hypothetical protein
LIKLAKLAKKASKGIGILRRSKDLLDKDTLKTIYSACVLPHFDYCALVWDNCSKTLQNKLQKLQNKAGRIITGDIATKHPLMPSEPTRWGHLTGKERETTRNSNDTNNERKFN